MRSGAQLVLLALLALPACAAAPPEVEDPEVPARAAGRPRAVPDQVIKGWSEVVQLMVEGEKVRVWIPAALAYGDEPRGGKPSGQLTFDIELHRINPTD